MAGFVSSFLEVISTLFRVSFAHTLYSVYTPLVLDMGAILARLVKFRLDRTTVL